MPESSCPVCHSQLSTPGIPQGDAERIECKRCGSFNITGSFLTVLKETTHGIDLPRLTVGLRRAFEQVKVAGGTVVLNSHRVEEYTAPVVFTSNPLDAADAVLVWVQEHLRSFSDVVSLNFETDYPIFALREASELQDTLNFLNEMQWVGINATGGAGRQLRLRPEGWRHLNALRETRVGSRQAFVAMRFSDEMFKVFDGAIYPAIYEMGFDPFVVNRAPNNNAIDDEIIANLKRSAFVVADFTDIRTAVFFEAGVGIGMGVPVIWCIRHDQFEEMPKHFDTRQYPYLVWTDAADFKKKLKDRIGATIPNVKARPSAVDGLKTANQLPE